MFGERKYALIAVLCLAALSMSGIARADFGYVTQWGTEGNGRDQFNTPTDVAVSDDDWVYVADMGNNRIVKHETDGTWLRQWSEAGDDDQLKQPLAVAANSLVYVTNTQHGRIEKFNRGGVHFRSWDMEVAEGQSSVPMGISVDSSNTVFVSDASNHEVQKFNSTGIPQRKGGGLGVRDGQFDTPAGIANDEQGNVYVADRGNDRIQVFSGEGEHKRSLTSWGDGDEDHFRQPMGVAVDSQGNIYVADTGNHRVLKFTAARSLLKEWGGFGTDPGEFITPTGLDLDSQGNLYIADAGNNRIQKFGENEGGGGRGPAAPGNGDPASGGATWSDVWMGASNQGGGGTGLVERVLKLDIYLLQITRTGRAVFELDCTGTERCEGTMKLSSLSGYRAKKRSKKSKKPRSWVAKKARSKKRRSCTKKRRKQRLCRGTSLGKSKFSVEAGKSIKIRIRLSKKKRRLLNSWAQRHRKLRLRITAKMGSRASGKVTVKRSFTLVKSKKKKRSRRR